MTFVQVIVKEGELQGLAPLGGDEATIRSQQVDFRNPHQAEEHDRNHNNNHNHTFELEVIVYCACMFF